MTVIIPLDLLLYTTMSGKIFL